MSDQSGEQPADDQDDGRRRSLVVLIVIVLVVVGSLWLVRRFAVPQATGPFERPGAFRLEDVHPDIPVDSMTFIGSQNQHRGTDCATATDRRSCLDRLQQLRLDVDFRSRLWFIPPGGVEALLVTRGDEVFAVHQDEVGDFLGELDSFSEVQLRVGPGIELIAPADDGFVVVKHDLVKDCDPVVTDEVVLYVSSSDVREVARRERSRARGVCV